MPARAHGTPPAWVLGGRSRWRSSCVFLVWPVGHVLSRGLDVGPSSAHPAARRGPIAWFTLWQAVVSTVLTLVLGLPIAYVLHRYRLPGAPAPAGRRDRAVRAADGRRRYGLPGGAARAVDRHRGGDPRSPTSSSTSPSSSGSSAGCWAHLDPRYDQAARTPGRHPLARVPHGHLAARAARGPRRGRPGLLLHVHLVRRRAGARRPERTRPSRWRSTAGRPSCSTCPGPRPSPSSSCWPSALVLLVSARLQARLAVRQRSRPAGRGARARPRPGRAAAGRARARRDRAHRRADGGARRRARCGCGTAGAWPGGAPCSPRR